MSLLAKFDLKLPAKQGAGPQAAAAAAAAASADKELLQHLKEAFEASKAAGAKTGGGAALLASIKVANDGRKKAEAVSDPAQRAALLKQASAHVVSAMAAAAAAQKAAAPGRSSGPVDPGAMQSAGKKQAAGKKGAGKPELIEMEPEEIVVPVARGLPGDTGEQQIKDLLQQMRDDVQDYWATYSRGLDSFQTSMSFASSAEAESKYLQVALKTVAKKAFDMALDEAGKKLGGPWGTIISTAKGVAEAFAAEAERVAAAEGQVKIRDYIISIRNGISAQQKAMTAVIENGRAPMIAEYRRLGAGDFAKGKASDDGVVVGEAAGLVNALSQAVKGFKSKMASESYFQQQFTRNFADTPGRSDLVSHGGVPTGRIYFGLSIYVDPTEDEKKPKWKVKDKDESWKLVTKAPNPDRVADSLMASLDGKKPWAVDLPKAVKISLEVEESGLNSYQEGWIHFSSNPESFQVSSNYGEKWFELAWKAAEVRAAALNNTKLTGGADY